MKNFDQTMKANHPTVVPAKFGFEIGEGWHPLVAALIAKIDRHLNPFKPREEPIEFYLDQVKEKYGELRFYYTGGDRYIDGLVDMAESMSTQICEVCGSPGERRGGNWIRTLCDQHEQEYQERVKNAG